VTTFGTATTSTIEGIAGTADALAQRSTASAAIVGEAAATAAATATAAWQTTGGTISGSLLETMGVSESSFRGMADFAMERAEAVSIAWAGGVIELGQHVAGMVPVVSEAFVALEIAATEPLGGVRMMIDRIGGALSGAASAGLNLTDVIKNMPQGDVPSLPIPSTGGGGSPLPLDLSMIPRRATGAVIEPRPGGSLQIVGEGGEREFIIPESKMPTGGHTTIVNLNVHGTPAKPYTIDELGAMVRRAIKENHGGAQTAVQEVTRTTSGPR
jgi:hypothetical protein